MSRFIVVFIVWGVIGTPIVICAQTLSSRQIDSLIEYGVAQFDLGRYDNAQLAYEKALVADPNNCIALYELAMTLAAQLEWKGSIKYAMRGLDNCDANLRPMFLVTAANGLDVEGEPQKAIEYMREALLISDDVPLLPFNLAVTFMNNGQVDSALKYLKIQVGKDPRHASTHLALGNIYDAKDRTIPALLAYGRFLALEPNSKRSGSAANKFAKQLRKGISKSNNGDMNLNISADSTSEDGDLTSLDMTLKIGIASAALESDPEVYQDYAKALDMVFTLCGMGEGKNMPGFIWKTYAPYFHELHEKKFTEAFVYCCFQTSDDPAPAAWITANADKVSAFKQWNSRY